MEECKKVSEQSQENLEELMNMVTVKAKRKKNVIN